MAEDIKVNNLIINQLSNEKFATIEKDPTQLYLTPDTSIDESEKGVAGGVATLDNNGKVPESQLPDYSSDVYTKENLVAGTGIVFETVSDPDIGSKVKINATGESQTKADKDLLNTGFISGCVVSAPNGVVAGGDQAFWYDSWSGVSSSDKLKDRANFVNYQQKSSASKISFEQLNGNWTIISKFKINKPIRKTDWWVAQVAGIYGEEEGTILSSVYARIGFSCDGSSFGNFKATFQIQVVPMLPNVTLEGSVAPKLNTWYWLKLKKVGNTFTLSYSTNGTSYQDIGSKTLDSQFLTPTTDIAFVLPAGQASGQNIYAYLDLSSESANNMFIGDANTPLVTYAEGAKTIIAKDQLTVLFPAGLNDDGTLKSEKFTLSGNRTLSITSAYATVVHKIILTKNILTSTILANYFVSETTPQTEIKNYKFWFNPKENKSYVGNETAGTWSEIPFVVIGEFQQNNGAINYLKGYTPLVLSQPNFDYVVESYYDSSGNWYRKYKSGWLEQGGYNKMDAYQQNAYFFQPFLKPFKELPYNISILMCNKTATLHNGANLIPIADNMTTTSMNYAFRGGDGTVYKCSSTWYACGQGA